MEEALPMTVFGSPLHEDSNGVKTSAELVTTKWKHWFRNEDGDEPTIGAKADAAATAFDTTPFSVVGLLKAIAARLSLVPGYPFAATPVIGGSGNVANASAVATLPAVSAKTNYLAGFQITGAGATAGSVIAVTVAGLLGGSRVYNLVIPAGVTTSIVPLLVTFYPPLPASATNTAITVTAVAFGAGNTNAAAVANGFVV
jgi:hypothetical protein